MPADEITPGSLTVPDSTPQRGRGRPRKDTPPQGTPKVTTTQNLSADVKKAVKTLDTMYTLVGMGLAAFGMIETATAFVEATEELTKTNEANLNAAPKLARKIASFGETGGSAAFVMAHAVALTPVVMLGRKELIEKAEQKAAREAANDGTTATDMGGL